MTLYDELSYMKNYNREFSIYHIKQSKTFNHNIIEIIDIQSIKFNEKGRT